MRNEFLIDLLKSDLDHTKQCFFYDCKDYCETPTDENLRRIRITSDAVVRLMEIVQEEENK